MTEVNRLQLKLQPENKLRAQKIAHITKNSKSVRKGYPIYNKDKI